MLLTQSLLCRVRPSASLPLRFFTLKERTVYCIPVSSVHRPAQHRVLRTSTSSLPPSSSSNGRGHTVPCHITTSTTLPTMASQTRSHGSHGHHHHHHHHNNVYLTSTDKKDAGVRITRIGLFTNLAMALGKFIGGYVFHSQALIADAYHALTDLVSDFLTLGTVSWSMKPPTERFPNGYGKVESIGALGVSSLLLTGGILMGLNSGQVLLDQIYPEAAETIAHLGISGHSHGHGHDLESFGPNVNAAWLAGGSIIVKEWLYRATMRVAKERKSSVLASNAVHHRIDSLTSIVALFTIGGTYLFHNATWLDPVGGLLISLMVIKAGWGNTRTSLLELADSAIDNEIKESVRDTASKALAGMNGYDVIQVRDIQGMKSGQNYLVDIELAVPGAWSVNQSRHAEEVVREAVGADVRGAKRVKVRFVPLELDNLKFSEEFIPPDVKQRHDHELENGETGRHDEAHASHKPEDSSRKRR